MRCFIPVLLLLSASALCAQPLPNELLWYIVRPQDADTSYLYGTMHSTDERAFTHVTAVRQVMPHCATVAGELDISGAGNVALSFMDRLLLPTGSDLASLYTRRQWKRLEPALRQELGPLMAPMMQRMKPFFILASLSQGDMAADRDRMLDDALMEEGRTLHKRVIGLETVAEQMAALDAIPLADQARMLYDHVLCKGGGEDLDALHDAYAAQDLERIGRITNEASSASAMFGKALITDRNRILVQRMDSVMMVDGSALFLIGAAHLPGPEGLVEGLRARGLVVRPVGPRPPSSVAPLRRAPHLE
ncbi:MAG: TraB/GumN family protein [Flavobacteriales bacterium]